MRNIHDTSRTPANVYLSGWRYRASLIFNSVRPRHKATLAMRAYAHIGFGVSCETRYQTQSSPRNPWYLVLARNSRSPKRSVTAIATGIARRKLIRGMAMHPLTLDFSRRALRTGWNYCARPRICGRIRLPLPTCERAPLFRRGPRPGRVKG